MSGRFTGLVLVYQPTGVAWSWVGHELVPSRRASGGVRVERWQALCRACDAPFAVTAKLTARARARYLVVAYRACEAGQTLPEVRVTVHGRVANFELRNCQLHRCCPDPADLV